MDSVFGNNSSDLDGLTNQTSSAFIADSSKTVVSSFKEALVGEGIGCLNTKPLFLDNDDSTLCPIGVPLKIDVHTISGERGKYARICIQINLENPLAKFLTVEGVKQPIIYEGLGALCFHCGRPGHKEVYARKKSTSKPATTMEEKVEEDGYGPWMVVQPRKNKKAPVPLTNINEKGTFPKSKKEVPIQIGKNQNLPKPNVSTLVNGHKVKGKGILLPGPKRVWVGKNAKMGQSSSGPVHIVDPPNASTSKVISPSRNASDIAFFSSRQELQVASVERKISPSMSEIQNSTQPLLRSDRTNMGLGVLVVNHSNLTTPISQDDKKQEKCFQEKNGDE
ncbi:hypothetical protein COLO4_17159 [Corchorus olitorius]|uniref:Zinc knuckle CX2CX4HX4C n=1 Tax=Corchorus olitorius TaxID=93759 RepID=A0A1R3JDW2_9ROSI|nr:hypothetical protein COLO4_17159 [Corchorus olitorius]